MNAAQRAIINEDIAQIVADIGNDFRKLEGKRILITGANGYLPSYMADTVIALNDGHFDTPCHVVALVRSEMTPDKRLGHLLDRDDVTFLVQDVNDPLQLDDPVDFIVHAASNASPKKYLAAPLDTLDANTTGTRNLLEFARQHGVESFLYFSSSETYGDVPDEFVPTPETFRGNVDATAPRAVYTESKRFGETLCMTYWRAFGVPAKIVRPFQTYGPGQTLDDGRVTADFLRNRVNNEPIRLLSDGSAIRAFCYISDAVTGYWKILFSDHNGEAFNIGDDREPTSIRDLAQIVAALEDPPVETSFAESQAGHTQGSPSRVTPDLTKARGLLGYAPRVGLREGLARTLAWYRAGA